MISTTYSHSSANLVDADNTSLIAAQVNVHDITQVLDQITKVSL